MAGYSGTPLSKKLGITPGGVVRVRRVPKDVNLPGLLAPLPDGARLTTRRAGRPADISILFCESAAELARQLPRALDDIDSAGMVWVLWPKKSSARYAAGAKDLTENTVRATALAHGVVDVKVCAVDETWSGLKLVYRRRDR